MLKMKIKKKYLAQVVSNKLDIEIDRRHIISIITILFEEIVKDIFTKGHFIIGNFGKFIFGRSPSRKFFNFQTGQVEQSVGNNILKFKLNEQLKRDILKQIDIERTFNNNVK